MEHSPRRIRGGRGFEKERMTENKIPRYGEGDERE